MAQGHALPDKEAASKTKGGRKRKTRTRREEKKDKDSCRSGQLVNKRTRAARSFEQQKKSAQKAFEREK